MRFVNASISKFEESVFSKDQHHFSVEKTKFTVGGRFPFPTLLN